MTKGIIAWGWEALVRTHRPDGDGCLEAGTPSLRQLPAHQEACAPRWDKHRPAWHWGLVLQVILHFLKNFLLLFFLVSIYSLGATDVPSAGLPSPFPLAFWSLAMSPTFLEATARWKRLPLDSSTPWWSLSLFLFCLFVPFFSFNLVLCVTMCTNNYV